MDDRQRQADELLADPAEQAEEPQKAPDYKADLQRMAADFSNYRKRNETERLEFAKYAKADLITKLLDVLDGYDRALESVPADVKDQAWVEGMWLGERNRRPNLHAEGLHPIDSLRNPFHPHPPNNLRPL